jgi:phage recombination protein Bet
MENKMSLSVQTKNEVAQFNPEQVALIKNYLCKGINDDELKLFQAVCKKTGLDPFMKQIYAVKRKNYKTGSDDMTMQTSIDGYRLIAERTGRYCPGRESTYTYENGKITCATSYVKKQTVDGTWHEVAASAYYSEYAPPVSKNGYENSFWRDKPHIMLAKCAESLALRKAFPNELSGLYSDEEMHQAPTNLAESPISDTQCAELQDLLALCSSEYQERFNKWLVETKKINSISLIPTSCYERIKKTLIEKSSEYQQSIIEVANA